MSDISVADGVISFVVIVVTFAAAVFTIFIAGRANRTARLVLIGSSALCMAASVAFMLRLYLVAHAHDVKFFESFSEYVAIYNFFMLVAYLSMLVGTLKPKENEVLVKQDPVEEVPETEIPKAETKLDTAPRLTTESESV